PAEVQGQAAGALPVELAALVQPLDQLIDALPLDILAGDPAIRAALAGAVEGDQVGVLQARRLLQPAGELLQLGAARGEAGGAPFQRRGLIRLEVLGAEDHAGEAVAEPRADLEMPERLALQLCQRLRRRVRVAQRLLAGRRLRGRLLGLAGPPGGPL